jgi:hypothetical protein
MDNNEFVIFGWNTSEEVASDVYSSLHRRLLSGLLFFGYKGFSNDISQLVIVRDVDHYNNSVVDNSYSVGLITKGYTAYVPHVPVDYLQREVLSDLKNYKVEKKVIESFEKLINIKKNE